VEVISAGNTPEEMQQKLQEYFRAGVEEVWYVYPKRRELVVYTSAAQSRTLRADQVVDGGTLLPGFRLSLAELFAEP